MDRRDELNDVFSDIDANERQLIEPLIDEVVFLEEQMDELKKLPFISVHPKIPAMQKKTEAAKLYKELCANYANIIRILLNTLRKVESSAQDELLKRLEEFQ